MAVWKAERSKGDAPLARAWGILLASVRLRRKQIATLLTGAALMAAAGALVGSELQLDELEIRTVRGPHLQVRPGQGGDQAGVTIP